MPVTVELENRTAATIEPDAVIALARRVLIAEGVEAGELGVAFVAPAEIRELKRAHLGIDEVTDVLAFPVDGHDPLPDGVPRQLGDVVLCPDVTGSAWQRPLVHALLHLLGHDHGPEMELRERVHEGAEE